MAPTAETDLGFNGWSHSSFKGLLKKRVSFSKTFTKGPASEFLVSQRALCHGHQQSWDAPSTALTCWERKQNAAIPESHHQIN